MRLLEFLTARYAQICSIYFKTQLGPRYALNEVHHNSYERESYLERWRSQLTSFDGDHYHRSHIQRRHRPWRRFSNQHRHVRCE
ncbi:hypothetical protein F0562_009159 [Nyssa sinensis]|uniref:Uncharacterized protein n=1 Tax=Nyssa sinensis TaxID=561372 RepID=A0A5J4ZX80_9ASTE|nr:hypothetical protein F0562_009159 [Nyssa sinensis]